MWVLSSKYNIEQSYFTGSMTFPPFWKSVLTQNVSVQTSKAFHRHGIAHEAKLI